jgi:biopolymer transport protein ExbD
MQDYFVYSVQMNRLSVYILFLSLFLLVACDSAKKDFMTPKQGEVVIDVNTEEYSLNGTVIGKTATDISNNEDLLIMPLDNELQEIRRVEQEEALRKGIPADESNARLHIDENLSYDVFYKVIATMGFSGYVSFQYVIGSNFREPLDMNLPERSSYHFSDEGINLSSCRREKIERQMDKFSEKISHKRIITDEILDRRIKDTELLVKCAQKFIDFSLTIRSNGDCLSYEVSLNESGLIDGEKLYTYENIDDVWKFIEDIRLRRELQDKEDSDQIFVSFKKDVLVKNFAPIVKKLKTYGYKIRLYLDLE